MQIQPEPRGARAAAAAKPRVVSDQPCLVTVQRRRMESAGAPSGTEPRGRLGAENASHHGWWGDPGSNPGGALVVAWTATEDPDGSHRAGWMRLS